jgi:hypothetical protein
MSVTDKNKTFDDFAARVWGNRAEGLPVPNFDLAREITTEEINFLNLKFAYVQIANPEAMGDYSERTFNRCRSGWVIINYKNAMSSSPGEMLMSDDIYQQKEHGQFEQVNTGRGTRIKQIIDTAAEMVRLAKQEEKWPTIHIVSGHPQMCWGIWKAAQDLQMPVTGYSPSKEDEAKYRRIESLCPTLMLSSSTPKP